MRISDWSSDVCSSDLGHVGVDQRAAADRGTLNHRHVAEVAQVDPAVALLRAVVVPDPGIAGRARIVFAPPFAPTLQHQHLAPRSEEHTSELQSLMRISYAVFCLKKNTTKRNN